MDKKMFAGAAMALLALMLFMSGVGFAQATIVSPAKITISATAQVPLQNPVSAFEDNSGNIYILDYDYTNNNIKIYDSSGNFLSVFKSAGSAISAEKFFVMNNTIYVVPMGATNIVVYNLTGGIRSNIHPAVTQLQDLYVDTHGNVYILDAPSKDILYKFAPNYIGSSIIEYSAGTPITLSMCASTFGCTPQPSNIFVDSTGRIYAYGFAFMNYGTILMDSSGNYLKQLPGLDFVADAVDQIDGFYDESTPVWPFSHYTITRMDSTQKFTDSLSLSTTGMYYSYISVARNGDLIAAQSYGHVDVYSQQFCGNGIHEANRGEQCDDGPGMNAAGNRCDANCRWTYCGDNIVQKPNGYRKVEQCEGTMTEDCSSQDLKAGTGTATCNANTCLWDASSCSALPICGDGIVNGAEDCDYDKLTGIPLMPVTQCADATAYGLGYVGTLGCYPKGSAQQCQFNGAGCSRCGDGIITTGSEQCDFFNQDTSKPNINGAKCADATAKGAGYVGNVLCNKPGTSNECQLDASQCYTCGDGVCNDAEKGKCLQDCGITGWNITGQGWSQTSTGLRGNFSGNVTTADAYTLSIKAGADYTLSADIWEHSGCVADIKLLGKCLSSTDFTVKDCFAEIMSALPTNTPSWQHISIPINIPAGIHNDSTGYYNGVKIQLDIVSCPANAYGIDFNSVSLKKSAGNAHYDYQPSVSSAGGCCPSAYCWNGTSCVLSDEWMNDSQKSPVWNIILEPGAYDWVDNHVLEQSKPLGTGYRCVLDENGSAHWQLSDLKYDWSMKESGYCDRQTDCFVSHTFNGLLDSSPDSVAALLQSYDNSGSECVRDGQSLNDDYSLGGGNHYCYQGNWTTKTYIMANALENFTLGNKTYQYIIFCDNNTKYLFNYIPDAPSGPAGYVVAGCVMVMKKPASLFTPATEQVIVGMALNDERFDRYDAFDTTVVAHYAEISGETPDQKIDLTTCHHLGSGFYSCLDETTNLKMYYNNASHYWIFSDQNIDAIDPGFLQSILNWFLNLFGLYTMPDYSALSHVNNYDRLYIMNNNTLSVASVDELKYDEIDRALYDFLYFNYTGTNRARNVINMDYILAVTTPVSNSTSYGVNYQDIIIKTNNTGDVWEYLTAMLRDRDIRQ